MCRILLPSVLATKANLTQKQGLGDTGHGWKPVADMLSPAMPYIKWILPHAPQQPVTANYRMVMPAWFDLKDFSFVSTEDENGMLASVRMLEGIIRNEVDNGMDASRIVLGGFSQGGVMALLGGLTSERKLGGVVVLSAWLPLREKFKAVSD